LTKSVELASQEGEEGSHDQIGSFSVHVLDHRF